MGKIEALIHDQLNKVLILLSLAVVLLVVRDIPFLNIFFPQNTIFSVIFITAVILFGFYRKILFYSVFTILTIFLYIAKLTFQAEQTAILIFVILFILIIDQTFSLFKR